VAHAEENIDAAWLALSDAEFELLGAAFAAPAGG
jgi:hypothetical protein